MKIYIYLDTYLVDKKTAREQMSVKDSTVYLTHLKAWFILFGTQLINKKLLAVYLLTTKLILRKKPSDTAKI